MTTAQRAAHFRFYDLVWAEAVRQGRIVQISDDRAPKSRDLAAAKPST